MAQIAARAIIISFIEDFGETLNTNACDLCEFDDFFVFDSFEEIILDAAATAEDEVLSAGVARSGFTRAVAEVFVQQFVTASTTAIAKACTADTARSNIQLFRRRFFRGCLQLPYSRVTVSSECYKGVHGKRPTGQRQVL